MVPKMKTGSLKSVTMGSYEDNVIDKLCVEIGKDGPPK